MANADPIDGSERLTPRQREVLELLRAGLTDAEIAERLGISLRGAKYHVSEIIGRLGVRNRYEAAAWPERPPWWMSALAPAAMWWRRWSAGLPMKASAAATAASSGAFVAMAGGAALVAVLLLSGGSEPSGLRADAGPLGGNRTGIGEHSAATGDSAEPGDGAPENQVRERPQSPHVEDTAGVAVPGAASTPTPCDPDGCLPSAAPMPCSAEGCAPEAGTAAPDVPTPMPTPFGSGGVAIDCAGFVSGIQDECSYELGARFAVQMYVLYPPEGGYFGFMATFDWTEGVVGYQHNSHVPLLRACSPHLHSADERPEPMPPPLSDACFPRPGLAKPLMAAGAVFQFQAQCLEAGETPLVLVTRDSEGWDGTYFFGSSDNPTAAPIDPAVSGAHVRCGPCPASGCTELPPPTPTPTPRDPGVITVDCDATTAGVQDRCDYDVGEQFDLQIHVTKAPGGGYLGFQVKLDWSAATLDYVVQDPSREAIWDRCTLAARFPPSPEDAPPLIFGCVPLPVPSTTFTDTGAVLQFGFHCLQAGSATLRFVPRQDDSQLGTHFIDAALSAADATLGSASITCR